MARISEIADRMGVFGDLDVSNIRVPYNKMMQKQFTAFDARQRYICIMKDLEEEIDFDRLSEIGVIAEHYPLHRLRAHQDISDSVDKYINRMRKNLVCGKWRRYAQPIHLIKKYYGERFAFYFTFFLTYNAWLQLPALIGLTIFGYQMYEYAQEKNMMTALDTPWNNLLGLILAIWASLFVESWRVKQDKLLFDWDMDTPADVLINDERRGQFKYQKEYNSDVNRKQKKAIGNKKAVKCANLLFTILSIGATAGTMVFFENATADDIASVDAETIIAQYQQDFFDPMSVVYGFTLTIISKIYEWITDKFIDAMNFRYRKDHNDARAQQVFFFNCVNMFLPLCYVAFFRPKDKGNKPFMALFSMLFIIFVIDSLKDALIRLLKPIICCTRSEVGKLLEERD